MYDTLRAEIAAQQQIDGMLPKFVAIAEIERFTTLRRSVGYSLGNQIVADAPARIGLEITETAVITDPEAALANLAKFFAAGIRTAINDYGSELSPLAYLKQLPAVELKIDRLFISGLTDSHRDPLLVRSSIDLAHAGDGRAQQRGGRRGKRRPGMLPIIVVTDTAVDLRVRRMAQGADDVIQKPVAMGALLTSMGRMVARGSAAEIMLD